MKTINQGYTKKERKAIAKDLRMLKNPFLWRCNLTIKSVRYMRAVLQPYHSLHGWWMMVEESFDNIAYAREALKRLAAELEATEDYKEVK